VAERSRASFFYPLWENTKIQTRNIKETPSFKPTNQLVHEGGSLVSGFDAWWLKVFWCLEI
jgi:hypothetical protein